LKNPIPSPSKPTTNSVLTLSSPAFVPSSSSPSTASISPPAAARPVKRRLLSASALDKLSPDEEVTPKSGAYPVPVNSNAAASQSPPIQVPAPMTPSSAKKTHKKRAKSSGNGSVDLDSQHRRAGSDSLSKLPKQKHLYKTVLCRLWEETGACKFGDRCHYAHGAPDLRPVQKHPKYKTEKCRMFHETGICPFGQGCSFLHGEADSSEAIESLDSTSKSISSNSMTQEDSIQLAYPTDDQKQEFTGIDLSYIDDDYDSKVDSRSATFNPLPGPTLIAAPVILPSVSGVALMSPWEGGSLSFGLTASSASEIRRSSLFEHHKGKSKSKDFDAALLSVPDSLSTLDKRIADETDSVFRPTNRNMQVPSSAVIKRPSAGKFVSDSHRRSYSENLTSAHVSSLFKP